MAWSGMRWDERHGWFFSPTFLCHIFGRIGRALPGPVIPLSFFFFLRLLSFLVRDGCEGVLMRLGLI